MDLPGVIIGAASARQAKAMIERIVAFILLDVWVANFL